MIYYISMLSTTGGKLKVSPRQINRNYNNIKKLNKNKNCVIGLVLLKNQLKNFDLQMG